MSERVRVKGSEREREEEGKSGKERGRKRERAIERTRGRPGENASIPPVDITLERRRNLTVVPETTCTAR